jgi:uncharacterized RDD family membrane protein YckC
MKHNLLERLTCYGMAAVGALLLFGAPLSRAQEDATNPPAAANLAEEPALEARTNIASAEVAESDITAPSTSTNRPAGRRLGDLVVFGQNVEVKAGDSAGDVVVLFGTATIRGEARDTVAILGSVVVEGGKTKDTVAVLGNVRVGTNSSVNGDVVAVLGNVTASSGSKIQGDMVAVGGAVDKSEDATVGGDVFGLPGFGFVGEYLEHCVLKLRPLAPGLPWLWGVVGAIFVFYLLVAVVFPKPVNACAAEIAGRPATTFLIGLMTKFLVLPVVTLILMVTGIGMVLIPFLSAAVLFAGIFGLIALLQNFGQQLGRQTGLTALQKPVFGFIFGWVILTALYLIPVVGFVVMGVTGVWALGAAALAMFGGARRELPERPGPAGPGTPGAGPTAPAVVAGMPEAAQASFRASGIQDTGWASPMMATSPIASGATADALALPRASFWERMAAAFLDVILIAILSSVVGSEPLALLVALAYFAGMWTWRGTTIGGIVLNLKVVRYDAQPITFAVALVRALTAAFSVVVLFLGFLWIALNQDRQAWHDKIAGTIVVRQPRGMPLLCL